MPQANEGFGVGSWNGIELNHLFQAFSHIERKTRRPSCSKEIAGPFSTKIAWREHFTLNYFPFSKWSYVRSCTFGLLKSWLKRAPFSLNLTLQLWFPRIATLHITPKALMIGGQVRFLFINFPMLASGSFHEKNEGQRYFKRQLIRP